MAWSRSRTVVAAAAPWAAGRDALQGAHLREAGPAAADFDPTTGRGRLPYPPAEYLFKQTCQRHDPDGQGWTLQQLRRSTLTHCVQAGRPPRNCRPSPAASTWAPSPVRPARRGDLRPRYRRTQPPIRHRPADQPQRHVFDGQAKVLDSRRILRRLRVGVALPSDSVAARRRGAGATVFVWAVRQQASQGVIAVRASVMPHPCCGRERRP